jgi:hypothetical protein
MNKRFGHISIGLIIAAILPGFTGIQIGVAQADALRSTSTTTLAWPARDTGFAFASQPAANTPAQIEANRLMNLSASDFVNSPKNPPFGWSADGCSGPANPEFVPACQQHDFGYRNYGARGNLGFPVTNDAKSWIDLRFREEMDRICSNYFPHAQATTECAQDADNAFTAVFQRGADSFFR